MSTINQVKLIGHLGTNPEAIMKDNKVIGTKIVVYVNDDYKSNGKLIPRAYQHQVSLFGKLGEFAMAYSKSGNQVYVDAKLTTAQFPNKDGITQYVTQVVASDYGHQFLNLTPKGHQSQNSQNNQQSNQITGYEVGDIV